MRSVRNFRWLSRPLFLFLQSYALTEMGCHAFLFAETFRCPGGRYQLLLDTSLSTVHGTTSVSRNEVVGTQNFRDDPSRVSALPDPPSAERLALIQEKSYRGGFEPAIDVAAPYEPKIVFGSIPRDLVGSLATNGPGRIRIGDTQYGHWFDGDGYVSLLSLNGTANRAVFNGRYVRSERFKSQERLMEKLRRENDEEALAHPPLAFSGAWTMAGRGRWYENIGRFPTNPANTATMWLESSDATPRLYVLCEGGHPIQLDPETLEVIKDEVPFTSQDGSESAGSFFSAHFKRCPITGDIFNHGFLIRPGPLPKEMNLMRLSSNGSLLQQAKSSLPFDCLIHDSAMTSKHMVFFLPPYYTPNDKILSLLSGTAALGNLVEWNEEEKAYVQINAKDDLKLKWRIELPDVTSLYHFVDAYDETDEDGTIILKVRIAEHAPLDRIELERQFSDQYRVSGGRINALLKEYTFHLEEDGKGKFVSKKDVADDSALCEFPVINPAYRPKERRCYCWTNALSEPSGDWLNGIQKVDMETGASSRVITFGPDSYAGPPIFVQREGLTAEDSGYILTAVYRSAEHRSDVAILDAATLETLCIMELRQHLPFQFHGDYVIDYVP